VVTGAEIIDSSILIEQLTVISCSM
jgi:hypothetical protein